MSNSKNGMIEKSKTTIATSTIHKRTKLFMNDQCLVSNQILKEYFDSFEKRNPQMRISATYIHNNETTPHLYLDYVPFATNQKQVLETKVANDKAIKQMGYADWKDCRSKKRASIGTDSASTRFT